MGLNIKNPGVERNIRELADRTGESLIDAVDHAVREKLARLKPQTPRVARPMSVEEYLEAIRPLQEAVAREREARGDHRTAEQVLKEAMDDMYDEFGLPAGFASA
jgi:hypothetical protein